MQNSKLTTMNLEGEPDTRSKVCTAALDCLLKLGYERTNMSDIARTTGIARPTLYKYFKSKNEVFFAAIDQVAYNFAESVVSHARTFDTLEERIIETIVYVVEEMPKNPYLALVLKDDTASALRERAFSDDATLVFSEMTSEPLIEISPHLEEQGVEISEMMSRFALSMILFPGKYADDIEGLRALIKRRVLPGLV